MVTAKKKVDNIKARITQEEYLRLFRTFPKRKKMQIAEEINKEIFDELWKKTDATLPDIDDLDEMILEEVKAVRYGKFRLAESYN
jgi:hypothetical protein